MRHHTAPAITPHAIRRLRERAPVFAGADDAQCHRILTAMAATGLPWGGALGADRLRRSTVIHQGEAHGEIILVLRPDGAGRLTVVTVLTLDQALANQDQQAGRRSPRARNRHQRAAREERAREHAWLHDPRWRWAGHRRAIRRLLATAA